MGALREASLVLQRMWDVRHGSITTRVWSDHLVRGLDLAIQISLSPLRTNIACNGLSKLRLILIWVSWNRCSSWSYKLANMLKSRISLCSLSSCWAPTSLQTLLQVLSQSIKQLDLICINRCSIQTDICLWGSRQRSLYCSKRLAKIISSMCNPIISRSQGIVKSTLHSRALSLHRHSMLGSHRHLTSWLALISSSRIGLNIGRVSVHRAHHILAGRQWPLLSLQHHENLIGSQC